MLGTSWPKGADLPTSRKRRKRPPGKAKREQRRERLATSQVLRKLVGGQMFDPTVPRSVSYDPVTHRRTEPRELRELECCNGCGGPLTGAFPGAPRDGTCAKCIKSPPVPTVLNAGTFVQPLALNQDAPEMRSMTRYVRAWRGIVPTVPATRGKIPLF